MKRNILATLLSAIALTAFADNTVKSPDGRLSVNVKCDDGVPTYSVSYDGKDVLLPSRLGLVANYADFSKGLKLKDAQSEENVTKEYDMTRTKQTHFKYVSNKMNLVFENK